MALPACGGAAAPSAQPAAPSEVAPASALALASAAPASPASAKPEPAKIELPPHGDLLYQLKIDPAGANISPRLANAALDKTAVVDQTLEIRATPKSSVGLSLPGVQADNFVLAARLRPMTGEGSYSLSFRREQGSDYPYVNVRTGPSTVGIAQGSAADNKFVRWLAQPQVKWPNALGEDVLLVLSVLGPDAVAYVNGVEAVRARVNVSSKAPIVLSAFGPTDGDLPFVSRLVDLQVFAADAAQVAALGPTAATAVELPPHGDLAYELKVIGSSANISVDRRKPDDKVEAAAGAVTLTAAPGGAATMALQDVTMDDFVAVVRLRPSAGEGNFAFIFHAAPPTTHSFAVYGGTGQIALLRLLSGTPTPAKEKPVTNLFGPVLALPPDTQEEVSLVISARGSDITVLLNGKETAKVSDRSVKGAMALSAVDPANAKRPYSVRVQEVKVYQPAR